MFGPAAKPFTDSATDSFVCRSVWRCLPVASSFAHLIGIPPQMYLEILATRKCSMAPVALEGNLFLLVVFDNVLPIYALEAG